VHADFSSLDRELNARLNLLDVGRCGAPERLSVRAGCRGVVTTDDYEVSPPELRGNPRVSH